MRRSPVAPFAFQLSRDDEHENHIGRHLDVWFVVYGDLRTLGSEEFVNSQLRTTTGGDGDGGGVRTLSNSDLIRRGLAVPQRPLETRYQNAQFSLLERVRICATTLDVRTETRESILGATMLDDRFANDQEFPNTWRSITHDDAGERQIGPPQPYRGFGSYVKATRLIEPEGAVFVEYHVVFAEPAGWFNGTNLLRSKLPIVAQEVVRGIRRSIATKK